MRILYICRTFTGLSEGVLKKEWQPAGAPTIYKMIEALDKGSHSPRFIFTNHGGEAALDRVAGRDVYLHGLRHPIRLVGGHGRLPKSLGRLRPHLAEIGYWIAIAREYIGFRPDIVYVDRMNVVVGALLVVLFRARVILRVMGIYPDMWKIHGSKRPTALLQRWAFRQRFAYVVCTKDGTDGLGWMAESLAGDVPRVSLLNGITSVEPSHHITASYRDLWRGRLVVLYVGRMEPYKGCGEFVDALLSLKASHATRIQGVMVGAGSLQQALKERIRNAGAEEFITLLGSVPHADIACLHAAADVYVSLNKLGNLSNANLEAMHSGLCMVIPEPDPVTRADGDIADILPIDAAIKLPREDLVAGLARALVDLESDPDKRAALAAAARQAAAEHVWIWPERIAREIKLLEACAGAER